MSPGGHGAGLGPRGLFCGALRARVGGWPCPRWLSPGSAPQCRAGKLGELAFVRERGDRVGQAACMGLVGCVPVNPGLCIEPECRSPLLSHPACYKSEQRRAKSYLGAWGGKYFGECNFLYQLAPPISNSNPLVGPQEQPTPDHDHRPHRNERSESGVGRGGGTRGVAGREGI